MNTTPYTNEEITEMTAHHTLNMQQGYEPTDQDYADGIADDQGELPDGWEDEETYDERKDVY